MISSGGYRGGTAEDRQMQQAAQTRTRANFTDAQWAAIQEESARISQSINSGDMFGGLGTVLTIAAIAFQPELAGMLAGGTATLGSSIAAGALIGAGTSVINGGDPLKGAITGGVGGAIGNVASGVEGGSNFVGPIDPSSAIAGVQPAQLAAGALKAGASTLINGGGLGSALASAALNAGATIAGNTAGKTLSSTGAAPAIVSAGANAAGALVGSGGNVDSALIAGVAAGAGQLGAGLVGSAANGTAFDPMTPGNQTLASALQAGIGSALTSINTSTASTTTTAAAPKPKTATPTILDPSASGVNFGWLTAGRPKAALDANNNPTFVPMGA